MELLEISALFLTQGGWGLLRRNCYPSDAAYRSAVSRLKSDGLIIKRASEVSVPELILTEKAKTTLPIYLYPEKFWNRPWNKTWYMLTYDVPEADRKYRNVLRDFLRRKRMGCLQKSVWVTPEDIRPDFDDLNKAANLSAFAFLFESRTVLGLPSRLIVDAAWNFDRLEEIQKHCLSVMSTNLELLKEKDSSPDALITLLRVTTEGYHMAMTEDPLLPKALHPQGYRGIELFKQFQELLKEIDHQLKRCT